MFNTDLTVDTDEQRTLFEIPAENMEKFEKQIAAISKKSVKLLGQEIKPFVFSHETRELTDGRKHLVYSVMLTAEIVPAIAGWTFVARLDHANETGTVIRMVPNVGEIPASFRQASSTRCDHCNVARYRRDTFVLRNDETGEFKQVGSTCLKEFFNGQDPYKIAKMAEYLGYAYECGTGAEHYVGGDLRYIDLESYLRHAAKAVREKGWVSATAAYEDSRLVATKHIAWDNYLMDAREDAITPDDVKLAEEALAWAQGLAQKTDPTNFEHNVSVISHAAMIEPRSMGVAAAIVGVYFNKRAKEQGLRRAQNLGASFQPVIDYMRQGASRMKYPKLRMQIEADGHTLPVVLSIAGSGKNAGCVNATDGGPFEQNTWYGRVTPEGVWQPSGRVSPATQTSVVALLQALAADPAKALAEHGKLTGQCCYCNKGLTDERSKFWGYGQTCAKNWNLPWGKPVAVAA